MSLANLPEPKPESIIYEDDKLYVCLARFPITKGHIVVVWKEDREDLHLLPRLDYLYLMDKVEEFRNRQLEVLGVEKVYLIYMDEAKQVHWHLVPRYNEEGFNVFSHTPHEETDYSLANNFII
ncbi:HIT family protein [Candidatus Gracilibacteria bacterium]|nr:HIT family protein [Candidatus Gracilibacteria bacterium]MCF7898849.1 HIT family protein [Candidatus Paceibacterota bacterium]